MVDTLTDQPGIIKPNILFIHCGGKHRMPIVVNALIKLGVRLMVVADIDILNDRSPLKEVFDGLGGEWARIEGTFNNLKKAIEGKRPELETRDVLYNIENILSKIDIKQRLFPKESVEEIKKTLNKVSPWSEIKKTGKSFIPAGDASIMFLEIINLCKDHGLFILEVGELEGFDKTVGGHGPKWVNQVLEKDLSSDPDLDEARKFVAQLIAW